MAMWEKQCGMISFLPFSIFTCCAAVELGFQPTAYYEKLQRFPRAEIMNNCNFWENKQTGDGYVGETMRHDFLPAVFYFHMLCRCRAGLPAHGIWESGKTADGYVGQKYSHVFPRAVS